MPSTLPPFTRRRLPATAALALALAAPGLAQPGERDFREAAAYSRRHGGHAVLVLRGDSVVFEQYHNGWRAGEPHFLASGTKSFTCALAAAAVADSLLGSLDERVSATVPELRGDPRAAAITVRQLLSLTGGLDPVNRGVDGAEPANRYASARFRPVLADPGREWAYGATPFDLFGELMRRKLAATGEDPLAYLERRVFRPIGLAYGRWARDRAGNPLFASGAALTAREWARFGRLVRDGGRWNGAQVIPEAVLRQCFTGTAAKPEYGLAFWLRAPDSPLPADLALALGSDGQHLAIVPSLDLVVVRFGRADAEYHPAEFFARLFGLPPGTPRARGGPVR